MPVSIDNQKYPMHVNTYATEGDISMTLGQKICGFIKAVFLIQKLAQVSQSNKLFARVVVTERAATMKRWKRR